MSDYNKLAEEAFQVLKDMAIDQDSWKFYKKKKDVEMSYRKSKNFNGNIFKFKATIPAPFDVVWEVMRPSDTMEGCKKWDKSISSYTVLKILSDDLQIGRVLTHSSVFGTVSAREFVDIFYTKTTEDLVLNKDHDGVINWIVARSVKYPASVSKGHVRGTNYPTGYALYVLKSEPDKTMVEAFLDTDIGGMLPQRIVEAALPVQQVKYLEGVAVEASKRWQMSSTPDSL